MVNDHLDVTCQMSGYVLYFVLTARQLLRKAAIVGSGTLEPTVMSMTIVIPLLSAVFRHCC